MKRDYKIWAVILGIIIAGVGITTITSAYVSGQSDETAVYEGAAAEGVAMDAADAEAVFDTGSSPDAQAAGGLESDAPGAQETEAALLSAAGPQAESAAEQEALGTDDSENTSFAEAVPRAYSAGSPDSEEAADGFGSPDASDEAGGASDGGGRAAGVRTAEAAAFGEGFDQSETDGVLSSGSGSQKRSGSMAGDTGSLTSEGQAGAGAAGQGDRSSGTSFAETAAADETEGKKGEDASEPQIAVSSSMTINESRIDGASDYRQQLAEYQKRLAELDAQIERMRSSETDNTVHSVKSAAQTEQRIWERELDAVYTLLIGSLDEESGNELRADQQRWIISRDQKAQEASKKNSGGSMESVEYIASIAASTRERVYALVERYGG